ncbi:MAG: hypothetical protein HC857_14855, partial [Synechococcales cyanobacterium RU_4_20]|nr:hypothetical protein [Synechococcales cyanobacterium RU_4_20]
MAAPTLASVGVTAPVAAAATLLPKWPGAQNGILDFAQPLTRWLAGSPSLQSAARHPKAFSPTDQLACFS